MIAMMTRVSVTLFLATLCVRGLAHQPAGGDPPPIIPNVELQRQINQLLESFKRRSTGVGPVEVIEELNALKVAAGDQVDLVRQFALAASRLSNGEDALYFLSFIQFLEIRETSIVAGVAPYLYAEDRRLKSFAGDCIAMVDGGTWRPERPLEPVNYKPFGRYLRRQVQRNEPIPPAFAAWIYQKHPGQALLAFLYGYEGPVPPQRDILWAEHVVRDAVWRKANGFDEQFEQAKPEALAELEYLSEHESWWVRLYVAEIIAQHPELRTEEVAARLAADENSLVREATAQD